jgi:hypothetical protein
LPKNYINFKELSSLIGLDPTEDVREMLEARKRQQQYMTAINNENDQQQTPAPRFDPVFDTTFMVRIYY